MEPTLDERDIKYCLRTYCFLRNSLCVYVIEILSAMFRLSLTHTSISNYCRSLCVLGFKKEASGLIRPRSGFNRYFCMINIWSVRALSSLIRLHTWFQTKKKLVSATPRRDWTRVSHSCAGSLARVLARFDSRDTGDLLPRIKALPEICTQIWVFDPAKPVSGR